MYDYSKLDASPLVDYLFYPRNFFTPCPAGAFDLDVPVAPGIQISCRFYEGSPADPWILFFHGNGEVVSDYDDIAPLYHRNGINLAVADYRGYGSSGGSPSFSSLVSDAHAVTAAVEAKLRAKDASGRFWIMGRSLGSIPAMEMAFHYPDRINGLIVESGFASIVRLIRHLGLPAAGIDLDSLDRERIATIRRIVMPVLILHGEEDRLVPLREAQDVFSYLTIREKKMVVIPGADHNDLLFVGLEAYFAAIQNFVGRAAADGK